MRAKLNPRHTDDSFVLRESQSAFESKTWGVLLWVDSDKDLCSLITRMTVRQENRRVIVHSTSDISVPFMQHDQIYHWSRTSIPKTESYAVCCYRFLRVSFGSSGLGSSLDRGHCVLFLGKTPLSAQVNEWVPANWNLGSNRFCIGSASIQLHWRRQENYSKIFISTS